VCTIRPHIYRHNFPVGSLKIRILDQEDAVIAESAAIDISDIGEMSFFHGYVRFDISTYLKGGEVYTIQLVGGDGYNFSESTYCGWVNGFDLQKYPMSDIPTKSHEYPLDLEIWMRAEK